MFRSLACLGIVLVLAPVAIGQDADWGDAPEGAVAYPSLGVGGRFPTCQNVPINSFIRHNATPPLWAYFGPIEDYEGEGNAGACPMFTPHDRDECFQDGDAGLVFPAAWTIQGGVEVPCLQPDTLAADCTTAVWGVDIDIHVVNNGPWDGYANVIADWDQDAMWGGSAQCPGAGAPEHVLQNLVVPALYNGPLSGLLPVGSGFLVGPNLGWVWVRFSITEVPVPLPWIGDGVYEGGESEDYLLLVEQDGGGEEEGDYGDAPEGATAYPNGIMGAFPTCVTVGPAGFVLHQPFVDPRLAFFGPLSDNELDGNAGACPQFAPYDQDECFQDGDAGLLLPPPFTMQGTVPVPCTAVAGSLRASCSPVNWGPDIDIDVTNNLQFDAYVNVLADWDIDGRWSGSSNCPTGTAPEHVLVDWPVPAGFSGPLSVLGPPAFMGGPNRDFVWMRFTISPIPVGQDWNGEGVFEDGETEDYLILVIDPATSVESHGRVPAEFRLHESIPNPASLAATIRFDLPAPSPVSLRIFDVTGRLVRTLVQTRQGEGQHRVHWDGRDDTGGEVGAGVYFYRLEAGEYTATRRLVLLR
jgi:hypothetical protein